MKKHATLLRTSTGLHKSHIVEFKAFLKAIVLLLLINFTVKLFAQPANALKFDPSQPYTDVSRLNYVAINNPFTAFQKEMTVEFWMYTPDANMPFGSVMGQGTANVDQNFVWLMHPNTNGTMTFYVNDGGTLRGATCNLIAGSWHHYAGVANATGIKFYIDGVLVSTGSGITGSVLANSGAVVHIGKDVRYATRNIPNGDPTNRYATMTLDEVRIWSRALCAAEINNNKNVEINPTGQNGLQEYYRFNQGIAGGNNATETSLFDLTSNGRNGTLTNFTLNGANSNWVTSGSTNTGIVNPFAVSTAPIQGNTSICTSGTTTLTNANSGGTWSSSNTSVATINSSGVVTPVSTGTTTISYTIDCGGISTATVTVNALPTAIITPSGSTTICQGSSVTLNANTGSGYTYQWRLNGNDISGATNSSYSATAAGSYTVAVTQNGCTTVSVATTINVTLSPTATISAVGSTVLCSGSAIVLNANTGTGLTYQWLLNGNTISGATNANYIANAVGSYTVVVTQNGCSATSSPLVISPDATPPVAVCKNVNLILNASGTASIVVPATTSTLLFEDWSGDNQGYYANTSTLNWNVTGDIDRADYVAGMPGIEIDLAGFANGIIESKQTFNFTPGSYTFSFQQVANTLGGNGVKVDIGSLLNQTFISQLTITNESATFTVTSNVSAKVKLTEVGPSDPAGSFIGSIRLVRNIASTLAIENGSTDNCSIASITASKTEFNCSNIGANTVTLTVTDNSGNVSTCQSTVTVTDNIAPVITCPSNITLTATSGAGATVNYTTPTATDICPVTVIRTAGLASGATFPLGTTTVTHRATDAGGNAVSCSFTVTVSGVAPIIVSPGTINVNTTTGLCSGVATFAATETTGIPASTITYTKASGSIFPVGTTPVTATATNAVGSSSVTFNVVVTDNQAPTAVAQNITVNLNASGSATITAAQINNGSSDACGIKSMSVSPSSFTCANAGSNTVTLTVTDNNNNVSTATAIVTVTGADNDGDGVANACDADDDNDGIPDAAECNKSNFYWSNAPSIPANSNIATGTINGINYTYTSSSPILSTPDVYNHGIFPASYNVPNVNPTIRNDYISDNTLTFASPMTNPVLVFASIGQSGVPVPIEFDNTIEVLWSTAVVQNSSTKITGTEGYAIVRLNGTFSSITFHYKANESYVNFAFGADFKTCPDTDNDGIADYMDTDSDNDGCPDAIEGSMHFALAQTSSGMLTGGVAANGIPLVAGNGQSNGTSQSYIVNCFCQPDIDKTPPTAIAQNITVNLNASGSATITAAQVDNGSNDACGIKSITVSPTSFNCGNTGANTVTLTVTDNNNNVSTATATVTVNDNTPPALTCPTNISVSSSGSACSATINLTAPTVTDNCSSINNALSFDGINDYVTIPRSVSSDFTIEYWMKTTQTGSTGAQWWAGYGVVDAEVGGVTNDFGTTLNGNKLSFGTGGSFDRTIISTSAVNTGNWVHVAVTRQQATGTMKLYINGVLEASGTGSTANLTVPSVIRMGVMQTMVNGYFNGTLDEVRIWNTVRSASEISGNMNASINGTLPSSLVAYYTINQGVAGGNNNLANTLFSATGTNNGTLTNFALSGAISNYVSGTPNIPSLALNNSYTSTSNASATYPVGTTTVVWTATDASGNTTSCNQTITVTDNSVPNVITQNISAYLDANGQVNLTPAMLDNGSNDACGIASMSVSPATLSCNNIYGPTGGAGTFSANMTVDNLYTVYVSTNDNVQGTAFGSGGNWSIAYNQSTALTPGVINYIHIKADDVGGPEMLIGDFNVTGAFKFANGTQSAKTNATDLKISSTGWSGYGTPLELSSGNYHSIWGTINGISSGAKYIWSNPWNTSGYDTRYFTIALYPVITPANVTLTVTDIHGNVGNAGAQVTVIDTIKPVLVGCGNDISTLASSAAGTMITYTTPTATDNCAVTVTLTAGLPSGSTFPIGTTTVTYRATDPSGNYSECSFDVNVTGLPPVIVSPGTITSNTETGQCGAHVNYTATETTGIPASTITYSIAPGSNFPVGTTQVTATATNAVGTSSCTFDVVVEDHEAPTAITQNISINLDATGYASIAMADINNGSSDACGIHSTDLSKTNFDCSNVGANTVLLTVTDVHGNISTANATVTVNDVIAPVVATQNISINLDATGHVSTTAADVNNGSADACGIASMSLSKTDFDCSNVGPNTVTLTVTDVNGNVSTATAVVTVNDITPAVVVTQNISIDLDVTGHVSTTAADVNNGSTDACGIASMSLSKTDFDCSNVGPNTVTLTVTDVNGNVSTGTATVTVNDVTPAVVVTQNMSINLDASGHASIGVVDINNGSTDACGIQSMSLSKTNFDCSNVGANTVTLTVTDVNGNISTGTATVTVSDVTPAVVVTQNISINLDASGHTSITTTNINNGSNDACGIANMSLSKTTFDCSNFGTNTVTLTVTDVNGNISTGTATVTVNDITAPSVVTQNISINLDATGHTSITTSNINNGSSDACGIASMSLSKTAFDCSNVGANTVTLTVTDIHGNSASNTATVTVNDVTAPVVHTQNVSVTIVGGSASITAAQINNGSTDACGIASLSVSPSYFNCSKIGNNTVTLTVTDVNGNVSTGTATVTVNGVVPTCSITSAASGTIIGSATTYAATNQMFLGYGKQSMTLTVTANGAGPFTYSWSGSNLSTTTGTTTVFTPIAGGSYTFICTATNSYGCQTTCAITICVIDVRDPNSNANNPKVIICHLPPGNPANQQTLSIGISAVPAHVGLHGGDKLGSCNATCGYAKTDAIGEMISQETPDGEVNLIVYPNPSTNEFNFRIESTSTEDASISVYDMTGKLVMELNGKHANEVITISGELASGVYMARVTQGGFNQTVKITKVN